MPVQHLDLARMRGGEAVGDRPGPVRRAVVDDEDPEAVGRGGGEHGAGRGDDALEVLGLVVGGQDEPWGTGHRGPRRLAVADAARSTERHHRRRSSTSSADLYELDGAVVHRVLAYRNAAKSVREAPQSVAALTREGKVTELPGIGRTLEEKIQALLETGTIPAAEKLRAKFPAGLVDMTRLPGPRARSARASCSTSSGSTRSRRSRGRARRASSCAA